MTVMPLSQRGITNSRLALGCMGLGGDWSYEPYREEHVKTAEAAVEAALSIGITMFDHADIYTRGKAEQVFRHVLDKQPGLRERIVIQSKCGIRLSEGNLPNRFDFSREHILKSVDGILSRLGTDYIDILLLHRPDPLVEPDEVAEALTKLKESGKVRHFGVSNMHSGQIDFLQRSFSEPFIVNQLELSLARHDWVDHGVYVNQKAGLSVQFQEGLMEYSRSNNIQLQAWGPLAQGKYSGRLPENASDSDIRTAKLVEEMAKERETTPEAIVLGWLMRHPAGIQPVIGTANPQRIVACRDAERQADAMTRDEWWRLYITARGDKTP